MKYTEIAKVIERRVQRGDYLVNDLPGERELATEQNVSHMTARRAVQHLVQEQVLLRKPNGRVEVNTQKFGLEGRLQAAVLAPAFSSGTFDQWRFALECVCKEIGASLRPVSYVHWDDPVIFETLDRFDAVFLLHESEDIPSRVAEVFRNASSAVVSFDTDLSASGIYSICPFPPRNIDTLLDHLLESGYRRVDCVNSQPLVSEIQLRIARWQSWREANGVAGSLMSAPVQSYAVPVRNAYNLVTQWLQSRPEPGSAFFCTILESALGAMRALHEGGVKIGPEVGVCTVNDAGQARFMIPSLTALESPDMLPLVRRCFDDIRAAGGGSLPPRRLETSEVSLFVGESTTGRQKTAQ